MVDAVVRDLATAPISEALRATLALLAKLTRDHAALTAADVAPLLALGVTRAQLDDALDVAFAFNVINRLADTFHFHVGPKAAFASSAKMLLSRGYRL